MRTISALGSGTDVAAPRRLGVPSDRRAVREGNSYMSLFDQIKDIFTTDDKEKAQKAHDIAEEAAKQAAEASQKAQEAKAAADAAAAKAGLPVDDTAAKAAAAEEQRKAAEAAETAQKLAQEAADQAAQVRAEHDAFVAGQATKAQAEHAAAAAAAAAANQPKPLRTYTVVRGDTLSGIGAKFHTNWHQIAELNHVKNPDLIYPGQVFKIPNS